MFEDATPRNSRPRRRFELRGGVIPSKGSGNATKTKMDCAGSNIDAIGIVGWSSIPSPSAPASERQASISLSASVGLSKRLRSGARTALLGATDAVVRRLEVVVVLGARAQHGAARGV